MSLNKNTLHIYVSCMLSNTFNLMVKLYILAKSRLPQQQNRNQRNTIWMCCMEFLDTWFSFMIANRPQTLGTLFVQWWFFNIFFQKKELQKNSLCLMTICLKSYLDYCHLVHNDMKQIQLIMNSRSEINFD